MAQDNFLQTVKQYVGEIPLVIPSSGDAAEDYDRRNAWYQNAATAIRRRPEEAMPVLVDHLDRPGVRDLIKRMDADVVALAVKALPGKPETTVADLATYLTGIKPVDEVFKTAVAHTGPAHPEAVRLNAVRLIGYIDHPERKRVLQDAQQNDLLRDQATAALERLGHSDDGQVAPVEIPEDLRKNMSKPAERQKVIQMGYPIIPALMDCVVDEPYRAYEIGALVIYNMPHDNLFEQVYPYTRSAHHNAVRAAAVEVIGMLDHPGRDEVWQEALKTDDPAIIQAVMRTARDAGVEAEMFVPFLGYRDKFVHNIAAAALFNMGDPRGYVYAYDLATVDYAKMRIKAVEKLAKIAHEAQAREHLERLKDDAEADIQKEARAAIQRLRKHRERQVSRWAKRNS